MANKVELTEREKQIETYREEMDYPFTKIAQLMELSAQTVRQLYLSVQHTRSQALLTEISKPQYLPDPPLTLTYTELFILQEILENYHKRRMADHADLALKEPDMTLADPLYAHSTNISARICLLINRGMRPELAFPGTTIMPLLLADQIHDLLSRLGFRHTYQGRQYLERAVREQVENGRVSWVALAAAFRKKRNNVQKLVTTAITNAWSTRQLNASWALVLDWTKLDVPPNAADMILYLSDWLSENEVVLNVDYIDPLKTKTLLRKKTGEILSEEPERYQGRCTRSRQVQQPPRSADRYLL